MSNMHETDQAHSNMPAVKGNGFTDLTNQFAVNITNVNKQRDSTIAQSHQNFPGGQTYQSVKVGVQPSLVPLPNAPMRGFSRASRQSQKSQRNSGLNNQLYQSQPSTANSKKRGATVVNQSLNNNLNILGNAVQNGEQQSHAQMHQKNFIVSDQLQKMKLSSQQRSGILQPLDNKDGSVDNYEYQLNGNQNLNQAKQLNQKNMGVGGVNVLNEGLGDKPGKAMMSSQTNMKSDLQEKDGILHDSEIIRGDVSQNNKYAIKSRSNITLLQNQGDPSAHVAAAASSTTIPNGTKIPTSANGGQSDQTNFMQKRISNCGPDDQSKSSRFAMNYSGRDDYNLGVNRGGALPNINVNQDHQTLKEQASQSSRKMSLAAKSGQMQVFNNLNSQNLNQVSRSEGQSLMSQNNANTAIGLPLYDQTIASQKVNMKHPLPPHPITSGSHKPHSSLNPNTVIGSDPSSQSKQTTATHGNHQDNNLQTIMVNVNSVGGAALTQDQVENKITHGSLALQSQSLSVQQSAKLSQKEGISSQNPNGAGTSSQTTTGNYPTPLGSRQFESYLGRKQIIQQQREKKLELLKQLDMGQVGRSGQIGVAPNSVTNGEPRRTLTDSQGDQVNEGFAVNGSGLRVEGAPLGPESSSHQGIRRHNPSNIATSHQGLNGYLVQQQHQGYEPQNIGGMSPIRAQRLSNQFMQPRGPNPMDPNQQYTLNSFDSSQPNLYGQKGIPARGIPKNSAGGNHPLQNANSMAVTVQGQQQQEFSQYLQHQLSPLHMVQQNSESAAINHRQSSSFPPQVNQFGQVEQFPNGIAAGNAFGISTNIQNLNCMQMGSSSQQSKLENKSNQRSIDEQQQDNGDYRQQQAAINSRITRKLEGGRPHKVYDYMFIQMSMEQFIKEYAGRKILIVNNDSKKDQYQGQPQSQQMAANQNQGQLNSQINQGSISPRGGLIYQSQLDQQTGDKKQKFLSPNKTPDKNGKMFGIGALQSPNGFGLASEPLDLNGLVKIRAYESQVTDEIPQVQCNLQPTQLDHLKVLVCEQEDKFHPKLTPDAANRFEIEKQNQIKQYMEDIIAKLQQKERRFKVTVKKKFVEDALFNSTQIRVASVYVIVINRDKTYDPLLNQKFFKSRKRMSNNRNGSGPMESSSEEEDLAHLDPQSREEYLKQQKLIKEQVRRSANPNLVNAKKRSLYDSDANGNGLATDNTNSTSTSSNMPHFKKLMQDKSISTNLNGNAKLIKPKKGISTGPSFKRPFRKEDELTAPYKYTPPVKEFKYGPTKIRITQDPNEHSHHFKHPFNVFSHQYNEFIRLVLKNQKLTTQSSTANTGPVYKFNYTYAVGLAKALGMNLRKEAFSEQNMKSREHVNQLKEKLIFSFWRKINESNKDLTPTINSGSSQGQIDSSSALANRDTEADALADGETVDSSNCNNTPKSKNLKLNRESSQSVDQTGVAGGSSQAHHGGPSNTMVFPPSNIIYKYVIGKGNNSIMVRSLFKNRFWWVQHDKEEMEKCQYCWTQIRKLPLMEALPCKYPNKRSGLKNVSYSNNQVGNQNVQQILTTPQQKSGKKAKKATQGSEKNSTNSKNGNESVMQSTTQQPQGNNAAAAGSAYADTLKFTETKLYNKIEDNFHVNNKKALFLNMKNYYEAMGADVFENIPLTFHVKTGLDDPEFLRFKQYYFKFEEEVKTKKAAAKQRRKEAQEQKDKQGRSEGEDAHSPQQAASSPDKKKDAEEPQYYQSPAPPKNIWIIKPGENTNRGHGIQVAREFDEIKSIIEESTTNGRRTCIVQKYIHNPLLVHRRKFDIRTYVLCTTVNGNMKVYIYEEGYLRTSCREYVLGQFNNKLIHLTNDAVQKRSEDYGKFEPGNKLSYNEFQMYLDKTYPDLNICFERDLKPQMNKLTTDIFRACYNKLDPKRRLNCMEVFGLDFMFDDEFRPYTIEVNTNPCLELVSPLLARLIPNMLENALKIALDTQFLPPEGFSTKKAYIGDPCPENRFELVFDSNIDNPILDKIFKEKANVILELDEDELSEEEEHDDEEE